MAHQGKELGVDLYGLRQAANSDLPTVASAYKSAASKCDEAHDAVNGIPKEPQEMVSDQGSVFGKYNEMHNAVAEILKSTRTNLDETAKALQEAANDYAQRDRAAAEELQRIIDQRGDPKPE